MQPLAKDILPEPFGLANMGSRCFFNSLLQGLFSCSAFIKEIRIAAHTSATDQKQQEMTPVIILNGILNAEMRRDNLVQSLQIAIVKKMYSINGDKQGAQRFLTSQQCCAEAYTLLMDTLEEYKDICQLFTYRKRHTLYCEQCNFDWSVQTETNNIFTVDDIETENFAEHLVRVEENLDNDCTCSKCGAKGTTQKTIQLKFAPVILFVVSKKYDTGGQCFPKDIHIKGRKAVLSYTTVAQIFHLGSLSSGHYWAKCMRRSGWYRIDDSSVTSTEYDSTENTYIQIYHCI